MTVVTQASYGPDCTVDVRTPIMMHRWDTLTFLHWSYDPDVVARLLPEGLTLHTFEDRAWVGLIPFNMRVSLPHTPALPWVERFCETNVRTYVLDRTGAPASGSSPSTHRAWRRARCARDVPAAVHVVEDGAAQNRRHGDVHLHPQMAGPARRVEPRHHRHRDAVRAARADRARPFPDRSLAWSCSASRATGSATATPNTTPGRCNGQRLVRR